MLTRNTVIIIAGPTAVGKTTLAVEVARHFDTEIISADSRQCFRELNIGVAKPSPEHLAEVPHHFINSHSIHDEVNAATYEQYALEATENIFTKRPVAVMVGGTGLYISAFIRGLDEMPHVKEEVRQLVKKNYQALGLEYLQSEIFAKDPEFWQSAEQQNPQRLMRALEVVLSTGRSVTSYRTGTKQHRDFNIIIAGLELPRQELYNRINDRVDHMMRDGLLAEVEDLLPYKHLNALQTVGYRELFPVIDGQSPLEDAVQAIKQHTRHYAKRQLTWFRKMEGIHWFAANEPFLAGRIAAIV